MNVSTRSLLISAAIAALGCGLTATPASAQGQQKIGVIDIAQVFERYQMTRDLEQRFDTKRRSIRDEAENRRKSMENQRAALDAFDPASQDFAERREKLRQASIEYKVWLETEEQMIKEEHMIWLRGIYENVEKAVAEEAKARNLDLVMAYSGLSPDLPDSMALRQEILLKKVIYFSDRVDLTQVVLKRLNDDYQGRGGAASLTAPRSGGGVEMRPAKPVE